ncbi:MAG TPA: methyltransferase domain-containing protein [Gemmatimonadaceae bacterium]|nr:methyltransferase domain-containing protein [Gemmatimonadaceae bacterium]
MSGRERWDAYYREVAAREPAAPSAWVMARALDLPLDALVLDLACGRGRHARALAAYGYHVIALDVVERAVRAAAAGLAIAGVAAAVEALPLRDESVDAVLCVNYLDRGALPHVVKLLRPGGRLIMETFLVQQRTLRRGPRDPAHLLEPGELPRLVVPLEPVAYHEGLVRDAAGERYAAGVVAVKAGRHGVRHPPILAPPAAAP